jgi:hypothetical protein
MPALATPLNTDETTTVAPAVVSASAQAVSFDSKLEKDMAALMHNVDVAETTTVAPEGSEEEDMKALMR